VKHTFDTVVEALQANQARKFTQADIYYFKVWWEQQDESIKNVIRTLVSQGRFEFVNGGWVSHDEACPSFNELIDNMLEGHLFLKSEFGIVPKIAWHIDEFGHSAVNAMLFAQMGFEAIFFARDDETDK
jgi:alpha-mannosidase